MEIGARRSRIVGGLLAAVLAGVAMIAGLAFAHVVEHPNSVTLKTATPTGPNKALFRGRVNSPRKACERRREVQIFDADQNPDFRLARGRTIPTGRYKVEGGRPPNGTHVYTLIETRSS